MGVAFAQAPTWTNERSINQLTEHVYRFGSTQNGMFVVTPDGIILVDSFCDNMSWLKSELQSRFKAPVKYVVLSHDLSLPKSLCAGFIDVFRRTSRFSHSTFR